jgi:hypothetical protein
MCETSDQRQVLATGEVLVDGGVLPGEADAGADLLRMGGDVDAEHGCVSGVRPQDGRQDADGGRLAGSVGTEQSEHRSGRNRQIDSVERVHVTEVFDETLGDDGEIVHPFDTTRHLAGAKRV